MPCIIHGTKNQTKAIGQTQNHCENCERQTPYVILENTEKCHIFYIPLCTNKKTKMLKCAACGVAFHLPENTFKDWQQRGLV